MHVRKAHYRTSSKGVRFAFVRDLWVKGAKRDFGVAWVQGDLQGLRCSRGLARRASECGTFKVCAHSRDSQGGTA